MKPCFALGNLCVNINHIAGHWLLVIGHWSLVIGHWSLVIGHWLLVIEKILLSSFFLLPSSS
ncbi:MAG: hypothetical protein HEQ27_00330 [Dolichospermum sp. JUN01]|nr:hypothetical protein [Dolichospermum sp. JUN01]